jgi:hypothetical protein
VAKREPPPRPTNRKVIEAPRFSRSKRRLADRAQLELDEQVKGLADDPLRGDPKTGALKGVRVVKFKVSSQQLLLAYQFDAKRDVLDVATHENFYRDLQQYLSPRA